MLRAPRLLLTILLPMIGGAVAGALYRGHFFGGYQGMIGGLLLGVMVAALLFMLETLMEKRHPATPVIVGLLAFVAAFGLVRLAYQPPGWVIYRQVWGGAPRESVEDVQGAVVYADRDQAILLRFDVPRDELERLLAAREMEPQPEDATVIDLSPFRLPDWWDVVPQAEGVERYHTVIDFEAQAERPYEDAPAPPEEHRPAHEYFARPGQLFYDTRSRTAYFADRSYWTADEEQE